MHVKAFGLMTRHPVKLEQVPPDLREGLPVDARGRVDRPPREARAARVPRVPRARSTPLRESREARRAPLPDAAVRRLEAVVARLPRVGARPGRRRRVPVRAAPPIVVRRGDPRRAAALARGAAHEVGRRRRPEGRCRQRAGDARRGDHADRVRALPRTQRGDVELARRVGGAPLRLPLRARTSCASGSPPLRELSNQAEEAYAFFNNNNQTDGVAQAPAGAQLLRKLLDDEKVPTA